MNSKRKAWVLDVGHGNATVIQDSDHVSVVDGGSRDTLVRFLSEKGINRVDTVIVSHADADHFAGISLLLASEEFYVGAVFVNPDGRGTDIWSDFVSVMIDAKSRGTEFHLELTNSNPGKLRADVTELEVLAPSQEIAYRTPDGANLDGKRLNANAMSAVIRVWSEGSPRLLLTGDIDQMGFDDLVANNPDIKADVLVFPHHGGLPGRSDPVEFASALIRAVGPDLVVFSIGRGKYGTPRPEIVSTILESMHGVRIACTQLSTHCAETLPENDFSLTALVSEGTVSHACCAGTIEISLEQEFDYQPSVDSHRNFITRNAPTALCFGASHLSKRSQ